VSDLDIFVDFIGLVSEMRSAQLQYAQTGAEADRRRVWELEHQLDDALAEVYR